MVAALTLPSLIQKYQYQAYVTQLQKTLNTMSESIKFAMAKDEVSLFTQTDLYNQFTGDNYMDFIIMSIGQSDKATQQMKKYFKIVRFIPITNPDYIEYNPRGYNALTNKKSIVDPYASPSWLGVMTFADGSEVNLAFGDNYNHNDGVGIILVDVNGKSKNPNQWGRDVFEFEIDSKGVIRPHVAIDVCDKGVCDWSDQWGCDNNENNTGYSCSARLAADGWKMKY